MKVHENNLSSVPILTPKGSEAGRLYFIPADVGLYSRVTETQGRFLALLEPLTECNISPDGKGVDAHSVAVVDAAAKQFAELLDYVTGVETASETTQQYRPFAAMSDGSFWASAIMTALQGAVKAVEKNVTQINRAARKWR